MLNVFKSKNLSIAPLNYYLTFAASDSECELEMGLRINRHHYNKLADAMLLVQASGSYIDIPMEISVEITRTIDAGDSINSISENISSKVVWFGVDVNGVTLSVAGYGCAICVPHDLFLGKVGELYTTLTGIAPTTFSRSATHPEIGAATIINLAERMVIRHQDMMLIATYNHSGNRKNNQPMTFYVQDVSGLWLQTNNAGSARWARFVSQSVHIPL